MHKNNLDELSFLNVLKFLGAFNIAILLHYNDHFLPFLNQKNPFAQGSVVHFLSIYSYVFVEMFFIISGILFAIVYISRINNNMKFLDFFSGRIKRIYPLLIITTIYMYLANLLLRHTNQALWSCGTTSVKDLLLDILFAGKSILFMPKTLNGPIWYIGVLLLCYIVAFFIAKYIKRKFFLYLAFFLFVGFGLFMSMSSRQYILFNHDVARGFTAFFSGVLLAFMLRSNIKTMLLSNISKVIMCIVLILTCSLIYSKKLYLETEHFTSLTAIIIFPLLICIGARLASLNFFCVFPKVF